MSVSDPTGDMLARIKNALAVKKPSVTLPLSKVKKAIADVMVKNGYLEKVEVKNGDLKLYFRYKDGKPTIRGVKRISKPSVRVYTGYRDVPSVKEGRGICVLSTPRGIMSGVEARKQHVGGEILCFIW